MRSVVRATVRALNADADADAGNTIDASPRAPNAISTVKAIGPHNTLDGCKTVDVAIKG